MSDVASAGVGTANLSSSLEDDGPYTISGVALGAGDITVGSSGIKKKWPAEELRKAAETLQGKPLVRDHQNDTDGRVGTVTKSYYRDGVGVMYEAEIAPHYTELAQDVAAGIQEVSARAYHAPVDELQETDAGALLVESITFDNLSVVSQGASPSNTAEIGGISTTGAAAMATGPAGGAVATLEQGSPRPDVSELAEYEDGDWVKGQSSGGTWHGKIRGMKEDGCYSDEIDGDQTICASDDEPVYLIENYDPESGEFTDTMVAHKEGSVSEWEHEEARKAYADVMAEELEADQDELDEVYSKWNDHVNMTASDLEEWSEHPCSDKASIDPEAVITRNMSLLETNKSDWGTDEIKDAKRTISFISRMSDEENKPSEPKTGGPSGCPSKWAISLLNWAYNPFDEIPDVPDDMEEENMSMDRPDKTAMPRSDWDETPEWSDGDMVRWQVEPDLFGKIVHVDDEKNVAMVEIMGMEDGEMESTGFTITAGFSDLTPMMMPESKADMSGHMMEEDEEDMSLHGLLHFSYEELQSMEMHMPEWSGTTEGEWEKPTLNDITDKTWGDLSDEEKSTISNHFLVSKSGFPAENFGDLALPVVEPNGDLSLSALQNAKARAGQVSGLSGDNLDEVEDMIDSLANDNFEGASFGEDEEDMGAGTKRDDVHTEQSSLDIAALSERDTTQHATTTMKNGIQYERATEDDIEEMSDPVVFERDDVESLKEKAEEADELSEKLDSVNSSIDELAENKQKLEGVDEDRLDELREYDEPTVLTDGEYSELQGLVDDIGSIFAEELASYSPFDAEELQERFTPIELRDKVSEHDDASVTSELGASESDAEPKGGSASEEELSQSDESVVEQATEEELREKVAESLEDGKLNRQAEKVRDGTIGLDELGIDVESVLE